MDILFLTRLTQFRQRNLILVVCLIALGLFSCNYQKKDISELNTLQTFRDSVNLSLSEKPQLIWELADSCLSIIQRLHLEDSLKIEWLELRTKAMISLNLKDSALNLLLTERQLALSSLNTELLIFTNLSLGEHYLDDGKNKLAGKCIREGFSWAEQYGDEFQLARANNLFGTILQFEGNYHESQNYLFKALKLFEKQHRIGAVGPVCNNIALNYEAIGDSLKSRKFLIKALEIAKREKDTLNILSSLNNLGVFYRAYHLDSAAWYFRFGLDFTGNPAYAVQLLPMKFNLGNLYLDRKEYDTASAIFNEVLAVCEQNHIPGGLARCYNAIAGIHEARNQDDLALKYYQKAYVIADSLGDPPLVTVFLDNLRYMYQKMGQYEKALQLAEKYQIARDSLLTLEKQVAVHELELLYNTQKAELENQRLNHSVNQMKTRIRNISIMLGIGLFMVVLISLLALFIYRLYQQRDVAYNTLFEQLKSGNGPSHLLQQLNELHKPRNAQDKSMVQPVILDIISWLEQEKPYFDSALKLEDVARKFNMNKTLLSNEIHDRSGLHFNAFINTYRVAETLRLLALPESKNYKIESIAKKAGFGSRAAFYNAFMKITGTKPSEFRNEGI